MPHDFVFQVPAIQSIGRFKAIRHTGHTYDADGNIVRHGCVIEETEFGRNKMTKLGFDHMLGGRNANFKMMVVSPSNATPSEDETKMGDAIGLWASEFVSSVVTASNTNPENGPLFRTVRHRRTFAPGRLGNSPITISKAGIVCSNSTSSNADMRAADLLCSGLLVDSSGLPTSISLNPATEYLDVIWEHTEILQYDSAGSFVIEVDGVNQTFGYTVRPTKVFYDSNGYGIGWGRLATQADDFLPSWGGRSSVNTQSGRDSSKLSYVAAGLSTPSAYPVHTLADNAIPNSAIADAMVLGSNQRSYSLSWALSKANAPEGCNVLTFGFADGGGWQILFDPRITKTATKQLNLSVMLSVGNAP